MGVLVAFLSIDTLLFIPIMWMNKNRDIFLLRLEVLGKITIFALYNE